jgi:molybdate transport system substrate-binding protein
MRRLFVAVLLAWGIISTAQAAEVIVFAPSSLTEVLRDVGAAWEAQQPERVNFNFSNTPIMAKQIAQGAPANIFICADRVWMDWLDERELVAPGTRHIMMGTEMVLIMRRDLAHDITLSPSLDLVSLLGPQGRLAMGDPASLPAGIYGKEALTYYGLWDSVQNKVVPTNSLRAVSALVDKGEVRLGVVYATEAIAYTNVKVVAVFPPESYSPVIFPVAIPKSGDTPAARTFLAFLAGPEARAIMQRRGFKLPMAE